MGMRNGPETAPQRQYFEKVLTYHCNAARMGKVPHIVSEQGGLFVSPAQIDAVALRSVQLPGLEDVPRLGMIRVAFAFNDHGDLVRACPIPEDRWPKAEHDQSHVEKRKQVAIEVVSEWAVSNQA